MTIMVKLSFNHFLNPIIYYLDDDFTRSMTAIYASEVESTRKLLKYQENMKYFGISAQNFSKQAVFTLHKASQEQIKQRNRRKSDQEQMHDRLLQLKMICHCGYGFCQGLKF